MNSGDWTVSASILPYPENRQKWQGGGNISRKNMELCTDRMSEKLLKFVLWHPPGQVKV